MFWLRRLDKERQGRPFAARGVKGFVLLALWLMLAAPGWAVDVTYQEGSWDVTAKTVNFTTKYAPADATEIKSDVKSWGIEDKTTWYYVPRDTKVEIVNEDYIAKKGEAVIVKGTVNLILCDGAELVITTSENAENDIAGIDVGRKETLNIYAQEKGTGKLDVTSVNKGAGIGARDADAGKVNIHGGIVIATADEGGAGIGGGGNNFRDRDGGAGGTVNIYGGTVTATGAGGAGIGGGSEGHPGVTGGTGGTVNIYGGRVTAVGTGAGIGGGFSYGGNGGDGAEVHIYGGTVTANSAEGAGIGAGNGGGSNGELTLGEGVRLYGDDDEFAPKLCLENKTGRNLVYPATDTRYKYMTATTGVLVKDLDELLKELQEEPGKTRSDDIVISGTIGINSSIPDGINGKGRTISGKGDCPVFKITGDTVTVNISDLNITGGYTIGNGGGVYVSDKATVNLDNCSIYGNTAAGNNDTTGCGGGLYVINATVNMTHCSIYGNTARVIGNPQSGLAGYGGGVYANNATVNMTHCSLYGNAANGNCGGGVRAYGASTLNMINCTVTGNKTEGGGNGGGVYAGDDNAGTYPTVNMVNCTLANNTSKNNSGVIVDGSEISAATLNAVNTVFWNETDTKTYVSCNVDGPNFSLNLYNCAYGPDAITGNAIKSDDKCFKVSNWSNTPEDVEVEGVKHRVFPLTKGDQLIGRGLTSGDVVSALNLTSATNPTAAFVTDALSKDQVGHTRNRVPDIGAWEYVNVEGVTLNKTELNLTVDGSETLTATVSPTDAVSKDVTWSTSSADVVSVDQTGKVKALKDGGPVTITARSVEDDTISASCQVTVTAESNGGGNGEEEGGGGSNNNSNNNNGNNNNNNNNSNNNGGGSGGNGEEEGGGGSGGNGGGNGGEEKPTPEKAAESLVPRLDLGSEAVINLIKALFGDGGEINIVALSTDVAAISGGRNVEDLVKALKPEELAEISNDHSVILAILPEITPNQTAVFVLGVSFDIMPEGTLKWHGYPRLAENSVALAADESEGEGKCLFLDDDGQETKTAPTNGHVNAAVELTKGYTYAPVITAETSAGPTSDKGSGGGCNAGLGGAILAMFTFAARQLGSRKPTGLRRRVGRPCRSEA